mmetsp:Transcript_12725/g.19287  ORF Transcript_12725/g.19287 Transcript_12725/m.19287 type:complete len:142 (-) Transcript_12725:210-635(-)
MVKRKRHSKKPQGQGKLKLTKNRGKIVVTAESDHVVSQKELEAEIDKMTSTKKQILKVKERKKRAPAPIEERKPLDYTPLVAGSRVDKAKRIAAHNAKKQARMAAKERRRQLMDAKRRRAAEEVVLPRCLGDEFFNDKADA